MTIAVQFAVSTMVTCSNLYQMTKITSFSAILPLLLYMSSFLAQIFIYCWYGNEVKLKVSVYVKYVTSVAFTTKSHAKVKQKKTEILTNRINFLIYVIYLNIFIDTERSTSP